MRRVSVSTLLCVALVAASASPALAGRQGAAASFFPRELGEKLRGASSGAASAAGFSAEDVSSNTTGARAARPDDGAHLDRRVLVESPLNPWIQPTTFLRVALLIIRNAALDNPAAGFLQSILTTELAYTAFTNVFASFAAAVVQDFSQGLANEGAVASEWVIDGETTLANTLTSEFVYGGAWGFEQFYGFGFEISGDAAAALQQSLQPTWIPNDPDDGRAASAPEPAPEPDDAVDPEAATRRKLRSDSTREREREGERAREGEGEGARAADRGGRRLLSDEEARQRNLPKGSRLVAQVRKPLPKESTRKQVADALARREARERRRKLLQEQGDDSNATATSLSTADTTDADAETDVRAESGVEEVTGEDIGGITSNWFDSFPAALPASIRDRLLAQLEEFVLDPQVALSLEIAIALVGVVEPGQGIVSAEAADEVTITFETVAHGYDAAVDVAADIEFGTGVAASASAGIAVSEAILDAAEVIDAVTDIVDEVNGIVAEDLAREEAEVSAQSGPSPAADDATNPPKIIAARNAAESFSTLSTATSRTGLAKVPNREAASATIRVSAQGDAAEPAAAPGPGPAEGRAGGGGNGEYDYFGGTDYDYEPFGAVSGTYAVAVSLIFLEQISLNGGSITII